MPDLIRLIAIRTAGPEGKHCSRSCKLKDGLFCCPDQVLREKRGMTREQLEDKCKFPRGRVAAIERFEWGHPGVDHVLQFGGPWTVISWWDRCQRIPEPRRQWLNCVLETAIL
jgi:hypothetical protein